ncbi:MAG: TlpA family protein disulfide reductase [Bacteroidetes bacterium]|nr:TlpA family protein disulfide reductase [Bacteroidota bacterium]
MKRYFVVLFLLTTSFSMLGCNKNASETKNDQNNLNISQTQPATENANNGDLNSGNNKAPNFTLVDTQGKKVSLSDYKGKVVIIDFWATWCPPCRRGIPDLIDIQKQFKNEVVVLGISVDTDTKGDVPSFIKNMGINYTVLFATPEVVQAYGNIDAIPTSFIIDKKGKIVNQHVGLTPKETLVNEIKNLLGKS